MTGQFGRTASVRGAADSYEQVPGGVAWIEALSRVKTELLAGADRDDAFAAVAKEVLALTKADLVCVATPADSDVPQERIGELVVMAAAGGEATDCIGQRISLDGSVSGAVFSNRAPFLLNRTPDRHNQSCGMTYGPAMVVPLHSDALISGILVVLRRVEQATFSEELLTGVCNFAKDTGLALSMAEALRRKRDLEILADRDRIARDLHDLIIQRIFGVGLDLQSTVLRSQSTEVRSRLTGAIEDLRQIGEGISTAIFELQSEGRESFNLRRRVHEVVDQQVGDTPVRVHVQMTGPLTVVEPSLAEHALAFIREALSFVARHAQNETIALNVSMADELSVELIDDGSGLTAEIDDGGFANARWRAEHLGGALTFDTSHASHGTSLRWSVPSQ